jgi:heat-inducible transcriptional repressor
MAFAAVFECLASDRPFRLFGNGRQTRDFTFVGDVVDATLAAMRSSARRSWIFAGVLAAVTMVLNERLSGLTLREIRGSLPERLRDTGAPSEARELLNIFIQEGDQIFDVPGALRHDVVLGQTSLLAEQPEFASSERLRKLLELTDQPRALGELLRKRSRQPGLSISIGREHEDPSLSELTVVTAEYRIGGLTGVIGVIGPTRMPYDKVVSLVTHTSRLITDLLT